MEHISMEGISQEGFKSEGISPQSIYFTAQNGFPVDNLPDWGDIYYSVSSDQRTPNPSWPG